MKANRDIEHKYHANLGKRLREARLLAGLSQTDLGTMFGVSFQQIQKYEKGLNRISPYKLILWAAETNVKLMYLLDHEEDSEPLCVDSRGNRAALDMVRYFGKVPVENRKVLLSIAALLAGE